MGIDNAIAWFYALGTVKPYSFRIAFVALALAAALVVGGARSLQGSQPANETRVTGFDPIVRATVAPEGSEVRDRSGWLAPLTGFDPIIGMNPKAYQETTVTVHLDPGQCDEIVAGEEYRIELVLTTSWSPGTITFNAVAGYGSKYEVEFTPTDAQNATATATYYRNVDGDWKKIDVRSTRFQVAESL